MYRWVWDFSILKFLPFSWCTSSRWSPPLTRPASMLVATVYYWPEGQNHGTQLNARQEGGLVREVYPENHPHFIACACFALSVSLRIDGEDLRWCLISFLPHLMQFFSKRWISFCYSNRAQNFTLNGRELWSSGCGKRLVFKRSWVRIPVRHTRWIIFHHSLL